MLQNVLFIPTFAVNLLSVRKLIEKDFKVEFTKQKAIISKNNITLFAEYYNLMYILDLKGNLITKDITPLEITEKTYITYNKDIKTKNIELFY